ncbi:redoxin family protein [Algiphilus aromaticivorans]|uniref:redoxin family protein n=1 Tax=Algiphilus aromaticivorans TaxID=382454 RepID=UPI0005C19648|nr:redoxin family protein [Algiphilus aromaticivorans]
MADNENAASEARTPRWRRWLIEALVVVLLVAGIRIWMQRGMVDGEAPALAAITLDGVPVQLADYPDGPVLLHFWAIWCGVCELTQSGIEALADDRAVLTVALRSGGAEAVRAHMKREGLSHPVVLDDSGRLADRFGVSGVPASFIIDSTGRIRYRNTGLTPAWELRLRMAWLEWWG